MLDTAPLRAAYRGLLVAARVVTTGDAVAEPPPGEWDAEQILGHVALVGASTIAAAYTVASGTHTTYDNRVALDPWSIASTVELAGGCAGLRERIRAQADVLCALAGPALSETELDTGVPARLLSNGTLVVDQVLTLRELLTGLAEAEIPGHTRQLLELVALPAPALQPGV